MKRIIGIVGLLGLNVFFLVWNAFKFTMDWVGRSTVIEDFQALQQKLPDALQWLYSTPWWTPALLSLLAIAVLARLAWPHSAETPALPKKSAAGGKSDPTVSVAAQMRFAKGRFGRTLKVLEGRAKMDPEELNEARHRYRATEVTLQSLGFKTPWLNYDADPVRYIRTNLDYIERVEPLISAKQTKAAKRQAEIIVNQLDPYFVDPNRL